MMRKDNSYNFRRKSEQAFSKVSILIGAIVGTMLGVGICFLYVGLSIHEPHPDRYIPSTSSNVMANAQSEPESIATTNTQPTQGEVLAASMNNQIIKLAPIPHRSVVICVDPGHPSEVSAGRIMQNDLQEVVINWYVAVYLIDKLQTNGYKVVYTKTRWDELVTNKRRAEIANENSASLLIRLHCDTGSGSGYTLYYPDRQGKKNGKIGPSGAIIKSSSIAANAIHQGMQSILKGFLKDNGVKGDSATKIGGQQGALTGSIYSEVPAVTIEMVYLSNKADAKFIGNEKGLRKMAFALANGISRYLPLSKGNIRKENNKE